MSFAPGTVRDSIVNYLSTIGRDAALRDINRAVAADVGKVSSSSIRSYLNLNVPDLFERTDRGRYRLKLPDSDATSVLTCDPILEILSARLYQADCFEWLAGCDPVSIHAVVTDPPYGLLEYSQGQQEKLRRGRGGVWRIPPSFDGHKRAPLPRFTILGSQDRAEAMSSFES